MSSLADMWSHGGRHAESTNVRSDRADDGRKEFGGWGRRDF